MAPPSVYRPRQPISGKSSVSLFQISRGILGLITLFGRFTLRDMKRATILIFLLLSSIPSYADAPLESGNYLQKCSGEYRKFANDRPYNSFDVGYFSGACVTVSSVLADLNLVSDRSQRNPKQESMVVLKYIDDHPEEWSENGSTLIVRALTKAFPPRNTVPSK